MLILNERLLQLQQARSKNEQEIDRLRACNDDLSNAIVDLISAIHEMTLVIERRHQKE
jgi:hypothetical protein